MNDELEFRDELLDLSGSSTPREQVGTFGTLKAAFQNETQVGSIFSSTEVDYVWGRNADGSEFTENDVSSLEPRYLPWAPDFIGATDDGVKSLKQNIDHFSGNDQIIADAGLFGMLATVAVQPFDLINYAPIAGTSFKGASLGRKMYLGARAGAVGTALQEPVLVATQPTRDVRDGLQNLGASVVFGMMLGSGAHLFDRGAWHEVTQLSKPETAENVTRSEFSGDPQSLSAARVDPITAEDVEISSAAQRTAYAATPKWISPNSMLSGAEAVSARRYGLELGTSYTQVRGVEDGKVGQSAESIIESKVGENDVKSYDAMNSGFRAYIEETGGPSRLKVLTRLKSRMEYGERVARALRNGDVDPDSIAVTTAARKIRRDILDPAYEALKQVLPDLPDVPWVKTSLTYLTRGWNRSELLKGENEFKGIVSNYYERQLLTGGMDALEAKSDAIDIANDVFKTLTEGAGNEAQIGNPFVTLTKGSLNGRTFIIPDNLVERFLNNDPWKLLPAYNRSVTAEVELRKQFGRADMRDQIAEIDAEYADLISKAGDGTKAARKLQKERKKAITNIRTLRDRLRGTHYAIENSTLPASWSRIARHVNFSRLLGGRVLSSLMDMWRIAQVHGLRNMLGPKGARILVNSIKSMPKDTKRFLRQEAKLFGIAERELQTRNFALADIGNPYAASGPAETFAASLADMANKLSLATYWDDYWKSVGLQFAFERFQRISKVGYDGAKGNDKGYLTSLRVGRSDFDRISAQIDKHGIDEDGLFNPRTELWDDTHALETFRSAVRADVDSVITTPRAGQKPIIADHPLGALALQFKSFALATHDAALIRGMGHDQGSFLGGMGLMTGMGVAVYYLKQLAKNEEPTDNFGTLLAEGLDRSGTMALLFEANNMLEPMLSRMGFGGIYTALGTAGGGGGELSSRYKYRQSIGSAMLGPSAGLGRDMAIAGEAIGGLLTGQDVSEAEINSMGRLLPFANHVPFQQFLKYFAIPKAHEAVR